MFFANLKEIAGDVPVLVLFTKFDKIINALSGDWMRKHLEDISAGRVDPKTVISAVQKSSADHFEAMKKNHWAGIKSGHGVKVLRVSNPSVVDYGGDISHISSTSKALSFRGVHIDFLLGWCPEVGVDELSRTTLQSLRTDKLRSIWAAAQNKDADMKLRRESTQVEHNNRFPCGD